VFGKNKKLAEKLLLFKPYSMNDQETMIEKALKINTEQIIIDSINLYYRLGMEEEDGGATRSLTRQLVNLQIFARKKNIPVIVTAQVYSQDGEVKPFGGRCIDHMAKTVVRLEKVIGNNPKKEARLATIIKHRSKSEGKAEIFHITNAGLE
jgi:RecA/RadA recombinase